MQHVTLMNFDSFISQKSCTSAGAFHPQLICLWQTGYYPVASMCSPQSLVLSALPSLSLSLPVFSPKSSAPLLRHKLFPASGTRSLQLLQHFSSPRIRMCTPPPFTTTSFIKLSLHLSLLHSPLHHSPRALLSGAAADHCSLSPLPSWL